MLFEGPCGAEILVGRNAAQNDVLTRGADADDFWMHADGPGAHVILRNFGRLDRADLRFAADLAAHFSKARGTRVAVTVANVRDVKTKSDGSAIVSCRKHVIARPFAKPPLHKQLSA